MARLTHSIAEVATVLRDGGLAAFATETVYGLGADATNDDAVARIFAAKQRPQFNPLIVHVPSMDKALELGEFSQTALQLSETFWPGPLTLVVPRRAGCPVSLLASAGLGSLAIRIPGHDQARGLLEAAGVPVVAPSANPSGQLSPTMAEHVEKGLGDRIDIILDGGACRVGVESTVVSCLGEAPILLRPGGLAKSAIETCLGFAIKTSVDGSDVPVSPGMQASHYAPTVPLRMNANVVAEGEALLAFGSGVPAHDGLQLNLSARGDLNEAAANLFTMLHVLDDKKPDGIAVMPIPDDGLGRAINDRLERAAAAGA